MTRRGGRVDHWVHWTGVKRRFELKQNLNRRTLSNKVCNTLASTTSYFSLRLKWYYQDRGKVVFNITETNLSPLKIYSPPLNLDTTLTINLIIKAPVKLESNQVLQTMFWKHPKLWKWFQDKDVISTTFNTIDQDLLLSHYYLQTSISKLVLLEALKMRWISVENFPWKYWGNFTNCHLVTYSYFLSDVICCWVWWKKCSNNPWHFYSLLLACSDQAFL